MFPNRDWMLRGTTAAALLGAVAVAVVLDARPAAAAEGDATQLVSDASRKLREEDYAGALRLLEQAVNADPQNPEANVLYQDTARQLLGPAEVDAKYRQLATDNPDDPLFAYFSARLHEPEKALAEFDKQIKKHKSSPWPLIGKARALERLGKESESVAALDQAMTLAGGEPRFRAIQAYALERTGKYTAAADAWRQVLAANPDDATASIGLGEALRLAALDQVALAAFEAAAQRAPKAQDPPYRIGLVQLDVGEYDAARAAFDRALGLNRGMVEALCGAAEAVVRKTTEEAAATGKLPEEAVLMQALDYATRAVASNPESARAHFMQGTVYETLGEIDALHLDSALSEHQAALDLLYIPGPPRVRTLVAKSFVLLRLARWDEAEVVARQALDIDAECIPAMIHAAHALCQTGKFEDAIKKYYKPGLKVAKSDARLLYGAGMAYWSAKKHNDAKKSLGDAVKADPNNGLYRLSLGELYYELKQYKAAVKELVIAVQERPFDAQAHVSFGRACTSTDSWEDAVEAFEKACELDDELLDEWLYLAIIYSDHLKDRKTAREKLEKFLELGGQDDNLGSWMDELLDEE